MGKGKHNTHVRTNNGQKAELASLITPPHRLPTLSEIKVKLPDHCFRPTVRESMTYVAKDIVYVAVTFFAMWQIQKNFNYGYLLFPLYWFVQG